MELIKECSICGIEIGKYKCTLCGALVCENCYNKEKRVCINCLGR